MNAALAPDRADRRRAALDTHQARARAKLQALEPAAPLTDANIRRLKEADRERQLAAAAEALAKRLTDEGDKTAAKRRRGEAKRHLAKAKEMTDAVANDQTDRTDKRWIGAVLEETAALEAGRGEDVERPKGGGLRIKSRDGLAAMRSHGSLSDRQYRAGAMFGDTYGRCRSGLRSQLGQVEGGGSSGGTVEEAVARRVAAVRLMGTLREVIHDAFRRNGQRSKEGESAILLVEQVAGEGSALFRLTGSGAKRQSMSAALHRALNALADHYKLPHD